MSVVSFAEFSKNPIAAVSFIMLGVVGYLYYDAEATKKDLIATCKKENEALMLKMDAMQHQIKRNDSLIAVYTYENKMYMNAIQSYNDIQK